MNEQLVRLKNQRQFLTDVLRAEAAGEDLHEGPHGIIVCAMLEDLTLYQIGSVSRRLVVISPDQAWRAINKIKFSRRHFYGGSSECKVRAHNPPIPTLPCFKCGVVTNETQSVHGVGHYKCLMSANRSLWDCERK